MLGQKKHQSTTMYRNKLFVRGVSKVKSNISLPREGIGDIVSPSPPSAEMSRQSESSMLVFRLKNKKEISIDKLSTSELNTLHIESSRTLEAELIFKERGLSPFWKESSKEQSEKLWLPKETDFQGLDLNYLNGFSKSTDHCSFRIRPTMGELQRENSPMTSWPSSLCSPPDITASENTRYCRKIRIYPTKNIKGFFDTCFRATRFIWNNALAYVKNNPDTSKSHISLRQNTMLSDKQLDLEENAEYRWLKQVPYDTRQLTLKQLASNYKTNFTLLKKKQIKFFKMSFKSKKNPYQVFFINKKALDLPNLEVFKRRLKGQKLKVRRQLKKWISENTAESDCIIRREKNRYYLCLPMIRKPEERGGQPYNRVALDPGVRTFQTFYSDQGIAGKIGDSICEKIFNLALKEDRLTSILNTLGKRPIRGKLKRKRYNLKKRCFLLRTKIKNIVKDLHWKTCHYLCTNFKHILLPSYDVSCMVRKGLPNKARLIRKKTVRQMLAMSPYEFKQRLLYMGDRRGCKVQIVNEAYTTQTCGGCGNRKKMGGSKKYKCADCSFVLDRDYNGARNIFLKYL